MNKKVIRYFLNAIDMQEKWLNEMATKGFRLIKTSRLVYEFETSVPSEYEYCVEFVADKSYKQIKEYQNLLKEMGFRSFNKNLNINYSVGKIRWRPWVKGAGMVATSPGNYNNELLILENRKDGKPFELHTDLADLINYYRTMRNSSLFAEVMLIAIIVFGVFTNSVTDLFKELIHASIYIVVVFIALLVIKYSALIHYYKEKRKTYE